MTKTGLQMQMNRSRQKTLDNDPRNSSGRHRLKGGLAVVTMNTRFRTWSASQLMPCRCSSCLKPIEMVQDVGPVSGFSVTRGTGASSLPLSPEGPR
ncbi:MAG: hypothetical protein Ct9H300mP1_22970 [Planctomycetaceae bacterium]|nr:MAG: hypothetical protein Ct9H300mP1_22970 [Planctomycetaceae bacterium]